MKNKLTIILDIVTRHHKVTVDGVMSYSYNADKMAARHVAYWLLHETTELSCFVIGQHMNRSGRSAIERNIRQINDQRESCAAFKNETDFLLKRCKDHPDWKTAADPDPVDNPASRFDGSIKPPVKKPRKCLMCQKDFMSGHVGERICSSCKETVDWRSGVAA